MGWRVSVRRIEDRIAIRRDEELDRVLALAAPRNRSLYVKAAVLEKYARDQQRGELDELRRRVARLERRLDAQSAEREP